VLNLSRILALQAALQPRRHFEPGHLHGVIVVYSAIIEVVIEKVEILNRLIVGPSLGNEFLAP